MADSALNTGGSSPDLSWSMQPRSPCPSSSEVSSRPSHEAPSISPPSTPRTSNSFRSPAHSTSSIISSDTDSCLDNSLASNRLAHKTRRSSGQSNSLPPSILARMDTSRVRRPRNAFFLFRRDFLAKHGPTLKNNIEHDHRHISRIVAVAWKATSSEERAKYFLMAETEKKRHAELYPDYRFSPQRRECVPRRRRVQRNGELDGERDAKIAKLILNGASSDQITRDLTGIDQLIETERANEQARSQNTWLDPCAFTIDTVSLPVGPPQVEGSFHYIDANMHSAGFTPELNVSASYSRFNGCISYQSYLSNLISGNPTVSIGSFDYTSIDQSRNNVLSSLYNAAEVPSLVHMDLFSRTSSFEGLHGYISNSVTSSVPEEPQAIKEHNSYVPANPSQSIPTTYASLTDDQLATTYSYFVHHPKF